jgi:chorismate lyase/3-hydroxybenzoate synthase
MLFISGTASITGHNTQFEGDVSRQTEVCLENIQHLLETAVHEHNFNNISLSEFTQFKVYIKDSSSFETVKTLIQHQVGMSVSVVYLQGDMCRSDLLVEIEALSITPLM